MSYYTRLMAHMRAFFDSRQGSAMPLIGFTMVALVGATGAAIDMGRVQMVQAKLSNSLDAAGLAAGATVSTANVNSEAQKYFYANYPANYAGSSVHDFATQMSADSHVIDLSVQADVPTTFMKLFGKNVITVKAASQVTRAAKGMELVLVMDNTGSMAQSAGGSTTKIQAAKSAATALLNILYGNNTTVENLWVGLVPFSQAVNIGVPRIGWTDAANANTLNYGAVANTVNRTCTNYNSTNGTYSSTPSCTYSISNTNGATNTATFQRENWQGCVESRSNGTATPQYDINDDPPSVKPFRMYYWPTDSTNNWFTSSNSSSTSCTGSGKKKVCTTTTTTTTIYNYGYSSSLGTNKGPNAECPQVITPMTANKNTILAGINSMQAIGGTQIPLGMAWGWRMLSPRWKTLWGGEMNNNSLPLDYNTPLMNKVVILMTDGDNDIGYGMYSAYGYPTSGLLGANSCTSSSNCTNGETELNNRTAAVCASMKAKGILIYTVALGSSISGTGQNLLKNCATKPEYYFQSPTTADLQIAFQQIGDSLANLRISK